MRFQGLIAAGCLFVMVDLASAGWPGFRGPPDTTLSADSLPLSWSPSEHVRWSAELPGYGQSSPVIWDDHVYVTSVDGANKETCLILAIDLKSGQKLWQGSLDNASPQESSNYVSKAAPTAVVDRRGVIVLFEGGNLMALGHDGKRRWERNLVTEYGPITSRHGLGSSLLQRGETVYVWIERSEDPYLLAIDPETGSNRYKVPGLGVTSWSTPVILPIDGEEQLVFGGTGKIEGRDPATGKVLWTLEGVTGTATPSPTVVGEGLLLIGATDGRGESGGGKASESNGLVKVAKHPDGSYEASFAWRAKRASCSFGSPMAHHGLAYFVNRSGVVFCLDLKTGEEVFAQRTPESCWATPLAVEDRIYLVGQHGTTTVLKAGQKAEVLAENRLWDAEPKSEPAAGPPSMGEGHIQYAVAAVPGSLVIRTGTALYCISK
jgi:outer membrane protein assembly factor BamB